MVVCRTVASADVMAITKWSISASEKRPRFELHGVTIHWKELEYVNLAKALTGTLEFYESEFPEVMARV
jgi:hypothetical protein